MKQWTKIGIAVGAIVLAIAAGTGAYAMRGDDDGGDNATRDSENEKRAADPDDVIGGDGGLASTCLEGTVDCQDADLGDVVGGQGGGVASICLEGTVDCQDTPLGDPMDQPCPEDGCTAENYDCPPDQSCTDTRLMGPPACADDVAPEACPAYKCVTMESDPPQTKCYWASCDVPTEAPVVSEAPGALVDPVPFDIVDEPTSEGISAEEAEKLRELEARGTEEIIPCTPADDCSSPNPELVRCLPPDCSISSDGTVACPDEFVDPPTGEGQTEPGSPGSDGGVDPETQVDPMPAAE